MKNLLLLLSFFSPLIYFSQVVVDNKANVFTLVIDYDNPAFEGGHLDYFDCPGCTNDSLPFDVTYHEPGDFGDISFALNASQDVVFSGTIIWMGQGQITYPQTFSTEYPFVLQQLEFLYPENVTVYDPQGNLNTNPQFEIDAENAWTQIKDLFVVREAMENDFKIGMHLYAPAVGMVDWTVAKWIVFLYKNTSAEAKLEELSQEISLYPNPVSDLLKFDTDFDEQVTYQVLTIEGKPVLNTTLKDASIDVSNLNPGTYFLKFTDQSNLKTKVLRFQKL